MTNLPRVANPFGSGQTEARRPVNKLTTNRTRNTKNRIFAIPAAPAAIPPNPKTAATKAKIKNEIAQLNMTLSLLFEIQNGVRRTFRRFPLHCRDQFAMGVPNGKSHNENQWDSPNPLNNRSFVQRIDFPRKNSSENMVRSRSYRSIKSQQSRFPRPTD